MTRTERITESNQTLQQMLIKVSRIRSYRIETGCDYPDMMRTWDKLNDQYHTLTADDKAIFDEIIQ